ncbi:hypothetical protein NDU88_001613 [Pleurodeles waltl]|uniref:Uncharacterized protein n=1 Tax=Pleurodeles waltl TaxID=8319 RepID=A0AAV7SBC2_PLEWA|nr:hypothetical protein NDU88_001613 [Pleurodeles waltl]
MAALLDPCAGTGRIHFLSALKDQVLMGTIRSCGADGSCARTLAVSGPVGRIGVGDHEPSCGEKKEGAGPWSHTWQGPRAGAGCEVMQRGEEVCILLSLEET